MKLALIFILASLKLRMALDSWSENRLSTKFSIVELGCLDLLGEIDNMLADESCAFTTPPGLTDEHQLWIVSPPPISNLYFESFFSKVNEIKHMKMKTVY
jgi:hypothetical protein